MSTKTICKLACEPSDVGEECTVHVRVDQWAEDGFTLARGDDEDDFQEIVLSRFDAAQAGLALLRAVDPSRLHPDWREP